MKFITSLLVLLAVGSSSALLRRALRGGYVNKVVYLPSEKAAPKESPVVNVHVQNVYSQQDNKNIQTTNNVGSINNNDVKNNLNVNQQINTNQNTRLSNYQQNVPYEYVREVPVSRGYEQEENYPVRYAQEGNGCC